MKKTFLFFALLLTLAFGLQMFVACGDDDDDDDDDDNDDNDTTDDDDSADDDATDDDDVAPAITHEEYTDQVCTDCHSDAHVGSGYTADDCLGCHSYAE